MSRMKEYLQTVRTTKPLVHHITNVVTVSECANVTLFTGGLPIMANSPKEVEEMVGISQALVLNIGTLHDEQIEAMLLAGRRANERGIPIVLDPVGAGATQYRTETANQLLHDLRITIVKGNAGEVATLAGESAEVRGVESGKVDNVTRPAHVLSTKTGGVVAVTGAQDYIVRGDREVRLDGGSPRMQTFVGSGCVAASLIGCFVGANPTDPFEATAAALSFYRKAAECAAASNPQGPIAYRNLVFGMLAELTLDDLG